MPYKNQFTPLILGSLFFVSSCTQMIMRSKEAIEAEENKPWRQEEGTVGAVIEHPYKKMTPHIGFAIPIEDQDPKILAPRNKETKQFETQEIQTVIDSQKNTIKILQKDSKCGNS